MGSYSYGNYGTAISEQIGVLMNEKVSALMNEQLKPIKLEQVIPSSIRGASGGPNVNIVDNRRFSAGMGAAELRTALDKKLNMIAGQL